MEPNCMWVIIDSWTQFIYAMTALANAEFEIVIYVCDRENCDLEKCWMRKHKRLRTFLMAVDTCLGHAFTPSVKLLLWELNLRLDLPFDLILRWSFIGESFCVFGIPFSLSFHHFASFTSFLSFVSMSIVGLNHH